MSREPNGPCNGGTYQLEMNQDWPFRLHEICRELQFGGIRQRPDIVVRRMAGPTDLAICKGQDHGMVLCRPCMKDPECLHVFPSWIQK